MASATAAKKRKTASRTTTAIPKEAPVAGIKLLGSNIAKQGSI